MTLRFLLASAALVACASTPRPAPSAAATPRSPSTRAAEPAVADTTEPVPLTDDARTAVSSAREALHRERFEEAQETLRACLGRHPDDNAVRMRLALVMAEDGHTEEALALLREGLRRGPEDADLWTFIGGVRLRQSLDGATIERRRGSINARPSTDEAAEARQARAWLEAARDAFAEALRARGDHLGAMEGSAVVATRLGAHADAVRTWERVVRLTRDRGAEEHLAAAVAASGDRRRALTLYEALVQAEPARASALAALAALYDADGRADDARRARARATFHEWVGPFTVAPSDENVGAVTALAPWFDEAPGGDAAARETAVRTALERLGAARTPDARALLAAFAWHHSHDAMEAAAWSALRSHGPDAADTLFLLFERARSMCTMRSSAESLARVHDGRLYAILARALPRDTGPFPVDAANALDLLGDARAVPLLVELIQRPAPAADPDNPLTASGFAAARARAPLALGGFDTAESRAALQRLTGDADLALEARAALYRLTRARVHLLAIERAPAAQRRRAGWLLANYVERAGTPEATAAAARAREAERRASGTAATATPR